MPYVFYKQIHLLAILMVFLAFGALVILARSGGTDRAFRKMASITHGVGLVLALISGFGLAARLGVQLSSGWVIVKLVIWLLLGAGIAVLKRVPSTMTFALWWTLILLGGIAAHMAISKPF